MNRKRKPTARDPAVVFARPAAERIVRAVQVVERGGGAGGVGYWPYRGEDADGLVIAKTTAVWNKGTTATLDRYTGTPGLEAKDGTVSAFNRFATVQSGRWVAILGGYLIAAEC